MRFFRHDLTIETDVNWYFCADDAVALPFPTRFGSGNWASERYTWPGIGEVLDAARPWRNGSRNPAYTGQAPCGSEWRFMHGSRVPPRPFPRRGDGVPFCCMPPNTCTDLYGFADVTGGAMVFDLSGFTDDPSPFSPCSNNTLFNGTWDESNWFIETIGGCYWHYTNLANTAWTGELDLRDTPNIVLRLGSFGNTGNVAVYTGSIPIPVPLPVTWPLLVTLTNDGSGQCSGSGTVPDSVTISIQPRLAITVEPDLALTVGLRYP
jgi:hypothetical protein